MRFEILCNSILVSNKNIQSVAIINKQGKAIEKISRLKSGKQFLDNFELFFMQCVLQVSMGKDFDEQYGPINYHMTDRADLTMLTFPFDDNVILMTVSKNTSPILLARKVVDIIGNYKKQLSGMPLSEIGNNVSLGRIKPQR